MKTFWIWGLFPDKENNLLNKIKDQVQKELISPKFDLHITLSGPYSKIDETFISKLKNFGESNYSIFLNLNKYDFQQQQFKSLYISINNSEQLINIRKNILKLKKFDIEKKYFPHISLTYGNHKIFLKKELISKLPKFKKTIKMSKIGLVEVNEKENIWKILEIFNLN